MASTRQADLQAVDRTRVRAVRLAVHQAGQQRIELIGLRLG
ncbi:hypothetical protein AB0M86_43440 [Streptomyces sp. NPDC051639]